MSILPPVSPPAAPRGMVQKKEAEKQDVVERYVARAPGDKDTFERRLRMVERTLPSRFAQDLLPTIFDYMRYAREWRELEGVIPSGDLMTCQIHLEAYGLSPHHVSRWVDEDCGDQPPQKIKTLLLQNPQDCFGERPTAIETMWMRGVKMEKVDHRRKDIFECLMGMRGKNVSPEYVNAYLEALRIRHANWPRLIEVLHNLNVKASEAAHYIEHNSSAT